MWGQPPSAVRSSEARPVFFVTADYLFWLGLCGAGLRTSNLNRPSRNGRSLKYSPVRQFFSPLQW